MGLKNIYSLDTGSFYTNKEKRLHWKLNTLRKEKGRISEQIKNCTNQDMFSILSERKNYKNKLIKETKNKLLSKLSRGVPFTRTVQPTELNERNVVSVFDSCMTRTLNMKPKIINKEIVIVRVFYFEIIKDLIKNGFYMDGYKYIYLTSSAGQIRTKKTVFIREDLWQKYELTFTCGLTRLKINGNGGMNVNKYLAYLALLNSATEPWKDFNIDKSIVVNDFETNVFGTYDYIDDVNYTIERKQGYIPINHTDGCGMVLPKVSNSKSFMVRLPWIKGLLVPFDFHKFIFKNNTPWVVTDAYGVKHDIIKEDIQIIFTTSQVKTWKYYSNWEEYKDNFKKYNCEAGMCNIEDKNIPDATMNYQMIQTLTDISDDELVSIASKSNEKIENLTTTVGAMLNVFNVKPNQKKGKYIQQALGIYPELLQDIQQKKNIRELKNSLVRDYRASKLEVDGKYTFISPDMYAFCEYLFQGIKEPKGLLEDGEVFCSLYPKNEKLDCLRSPHLYREHAVRKNVHDTDKAYWFKGNNLYTSSKDLISKLLQFDVDGDKSLVIADETLIRVAERNMKDVVPLYYNMKKAEATQLTNDNIYEGLRMAFTGGNIGMVSNNITKIWNSDVFINGDKEKQSEALDVIKLLCMENNFVIDYAKTLYKPERPAQINNIIRKYTKSKVPYFFVYAKEKDVQNVEPTNNSVVNKLQAIIKDKKLLFKNIFANKFNYKMLMNDPNIEVDTEVCEAYMKFLMKLRYVLNAETKDHTNTDYMYHLLRKHLSTFGYSDEEVCDMLIKDLYIRQSVAKEVFWHTYGDIILKNLKAHITPFTQICSVCGDRFNKTSGNNIYCQKCKNKEKKRYYVRCSDCGLLFRVARNGGAKSLKKRCNHCQAEYRKKYINEINKRNRVLNKMKEKDVKDVISNDIMSIQMVSSEHLCEIIPNILDYIYC